MKYPVILLSLLTVAPAVHAAVIVHQYFDNNTLDYRRFDLAPSATSPSSFFRDVTGAAGVYEPPMIAGSSTDATQRYLRCKVWQATAATTQAGSRVEHFYNADGTLPNQTVKFLAQFKLPPTVVDPTSPANTVANEVGTLFQVSESYATTSTCPIASEIVLVRLRTPDKVSTDGVIEVLNADGTVAQAATLMGVAPRGTAWKTLTLLVKFATATTGGVVKVYDPDPSTNPTPIATLSSVTTYHNPGVNTTASTAIFQAGIHTGPLTTAQNWRAEAWIRQLKIYQ